MYHRLLILMLSAFFAIPGSSFSQNKSLPQHWSFILPVKSPQPEVDLSEWLENPIDSFILARLERLQITPSTRADPITLIRRLSLDLTGLPPDPQQVQRFISDHRPDAYERLVDRLLTSPHYGERWARPWLDLCHYADSDGYLTDQLRPYAWRHRQWVVNALNQDMPFDQFTVEQLAGDQLPHSQTDQKIATGFLRHTLSNREGGADLEEFRVKQTLDRTRMVGDIWLGLTIGCAQCHDHKYDPLTQKDFFQLYSFFNNADEININAPLPGEEGPYAVQRVSYLKKRHEILAPIERDLITLQDRWEKKLLYAAHNPGNDHRWDRQWELLGLIWGGGLGEGQLEGVEIVKVHRANRTTLQNERLQDYFLNHGSLVDPKEFSRLKLGKHVSKLQQARKDLPPMTRAPTLKTAQNRRPNYIHLRGEFRSPGMAIKPDIPAIFAVSLNRDSPTRLDLANWLVSPENPITARVLVNRMWQEFFGQGLVDTPEDFGMRGNTPSHDKLLDWLAVDLVQGGWAVKRLHKLIVMSATYRQSSKTREDLIEQDPGNRLLARQTSIRLSAETIRDSALKVSGLLSNRIGGPSVFPPQPDRVNMEAFGSNPWPISEGENRYRRGLYTFLLRTSPYAPFTIFDAPNPNQTCARRNRSNTPLQALTLLNDEVFLEAARHLAARIIRESNNGLQARITLGFRLCLAREPSEEESRRLTAYFMEQVRIFNSDPQASSILSLPGNTSTESDTFAAWVGVSSVLLNLHEFITRE